MFIFVDSSCDCNFDLVDDSPSLFLTMARQSFVSPIPLKFLSLACRVRCAIAVEETGIN
jgi:hypothetical protein